MLHCILYVGRILELTKQEKMDMKFETWNIKEYVWARITEKSRKRMNKS
jgi:hypothetical protein